MVGGLGESPWCPLPEAAHVFAVLGPQQHGAVSRSCEDPELLGDVEDLHAHQLLAFDLPRPQQGRLITNRLRGQRPHQVL